jgi:hypothetical protein
LAELLLREVAPTLERLEELREVAEELREVVAVLREAPVPEVLTEDVERDAPERETPVRPVEEARRTEDPLAPPETRLLPPPLRRVVTPEMLREAAERPLAPPRETKLRELRLASR